MGELRTSDRGRQGRGTFVPQRPGPISLNRVRPVLQEQVRRKVLANSNLPIFSNGQPLGAVGQREEFRGSREDSRPIDLPNKLEVGLSSREASSDGRECLSSRPSRVSRDRGPPSKGKDNVKGKLANLPKGGAELKDSSDYPIGARLKFFAGEWGGARFQGACFLQVKIQSKLLFSQS